MNEKRRVTREFSSWERRVWNPVREVFGSLAWPVKAYRHMLRVRANEMGRRRALDRFFVDIICSAGENAVHSGQFTRQQINQMYLMFGKRMGLTDLLPKQFMLSRRDQKLLKGAILKRIGPDVRAAFKAKQKARRKSTSLKAIKFRLRQKLQHLNEAA